MRVKVKTLHLPELKTILDQGATRVESKYVSSRAIGTIKLIQLNVDLSPVLQLKLFATQMLHLFIAGVWDGVDESLDVVCQCPHSI